MQGSCYARIKDSPIDLVHSRETCQALSTLTLLLMRVPGCDILLSVKGLDRIISHSREVMGGTPVFAGTRVPVQNLIDCLEAGDSIDLFLYDFPTVSREQVIAVLEAAKEELLSAASS